MHGISIKAGLPSVQVKDSLSFSNLIQIEINNKADLALKALIFKAIPEMFTSSAGMISIGNLPPATQQERSSSS